MSYPLQARVETASVDRSNDLLRLVKSLVNTSLSQGNFTDVCLHAYSRRIGTGQPGVLRPVYANSAFLRSASPYFVQLFSDAMDSEIDDLLISRSSDRDEFSADDSDLEDEDEASLAESSKSDDKMSMSSFDSALISDVTVGGMPTLAASTKPEARRTASRQDVKSVILQGSALVTCEALVYFIYTGEVSFAPLKSHGAKVRAEAISIYKRESPERPAPCSPKSMYRLAVLTGLADLKALAYDNIRSQLSPSIISTELFSHFSSRYPDLLELQVDYLAQNRSNKVISRDMTRHLRYVACERVPYAADALQMLYEVCVVIPPHTPDDSADKYFPEPNYSPSLRHDIPSIESSTFAETAPSIKCPEASSIEISSLAHLGKGGRKNKKGPSCKRVVEQPDSLFEKQSLEDLKVSDVPPEHQ